MRQQALRRAARAFSLILLSMLLASCGLFGRHGYFRDRGDDYVKAAEIAPMTVPAGRDSTAISELYVIPNIPNDYVDTEKEFEAPRPDFKSVRDRSVVRIQTLDQRRWIALNLNPSEVWPRIQYFLMQQHLGLDVSDLPSGTMETVWLTPKDNPQLHDRYRIRVEPGIAPTSTEIHVLELSVSGATPSRTGIAWPSQSTDADKEKNLLDALAAELTGEDKTGASLLAQSVGGARKVDFAGSPETEASLVFHVDRARAWASVGAALAQAPFAITGGDEAQGRYDLTFDPTPPDAGKPGFFCRLTGCVQRAAAARARNLQHYRLQFAEPDTAGVSVTLRQDNGEPVAFRDAERVLSLLRRQLD